MTEASAPAHLIVELPGLPVAALTWGPADGPLALLVHGFPDTAWGWRRVAPLLADAGWRVVAPFSRGYAPTGFAPDGEYGVGALTRDVIGLHDALGGDERALLVGHDWGAYTVYGVAGVAPQRFARIVAMSVPPIPAMVRTTRTPSGALLTARQLRNSWYVLANQVPGLSERAFDPLVARLWADWSPGWDAGVDLAHLRDALPSRARRTAALTYYRHNLQPWRRTGFGAERRAAMAVPGVPLLYLHGERDGCMRPEFAAGVPDVLAPDSRTQLVAAAGHFLQLEQPDVVAGHILDFACRPAGVQ